MDLNQLRAIFRGDKAEAIRNKLEELDTVETEIASLTSKRQQIDAELNELVSGISTNSRPPRSTGAGRRNGVRDNVMEAIRGGAKTPSEIRSAMGIAQGDKTGAQSVANAISALKRDGAIIDGGNRSYLPAEH